jgi:predicted RNase H-like nuclease (RuvC/YqgF family)
MSNVGYHARRVRSLTKLEDKIDELSRTIEELGKAAEILQRDLTDLKRRIPRGSK